MIHSNDIKQLSWQEFASLDDVEVEIDGNKLYLSYGQSLSDQSYDRFTTRVPADSLGDYTWEDILDKNFDNDEVIDTFKSLQQDVVEQLKDFESDQLLIESEADTSQSIQSIYYYDGFQAPQLYAHSLEEFKEKLSHKEIGFKEGLLLSQKEVRPEVYQDMLNQLEAFEKGYIYREETCSEYHLFINPTLEDLQNANRRMGLDANTFLENLNFEQESHQSKDQVLAYTGKYYSVCDEGYER